MKSNYLQGLLFLIMAQVMVALNIVYTKFIVAELPIFFLLAARFTLAALVLLPLHWTTAASKTPLRGHFSKMGGRDWVFISTQALCAGFLFNLLMLLGLKLTDANAAGIITSALPAIIVLLSWLFLKEKLTGKKAICVLFATIGLITIAWGKLQRLGISHSFWGDLIILLALLPEATYYVLCQIYTSRLPIFILTSLLNGICAILFFILFLFSAWPEMNFSLSLWLILFVLGAGSGLFYVFWYFGSQRVDMVLASLTTAVMPVSTVVFARIILGEQLSSAQWLGMGMVIFSIAVYAKR